MKYIPSLKSFLRLTCLVSLLCICSSNVEAALHKIYVDHSASGFANGTSWHDAFTDIESALDYARNLPPIDLTLIWIAEGVYSPSVDIGGGTGSGTSNYTFHINANVNLLGGFAGWETSPTQRIKYKHPTVLSGDRIGDDVYTNDPSSSSFPAINTTDNSYNIIRISKDVTTTVTFSHLTFRGGNAAHPSTLSKRRGGAIWYEGIDNPFTSLSIHDCIFEYNIANDQGGAIGVYGRVTEAPIGLFNCQFLYNKSLHDGGAISVDGIGQKTCFDININYSIFYKNKSEDNGGAVYYNATNSGCINTDIRNCTFNKNSADGEGGGIYAIEDENKSLLDIVNTIFWANDDGTGISSFKVKHFEVEIDYSIYPESDGDNKNIAEDPMFRNVVRGNLKLSKGSPAIDKGSPISSSFGGDIEYVRRQSGQRVDMGAHEYLQCPSSNVIYVDSRYDADLATDNDGLTHATAFKDLDKALEMSCDCNSLVEVQVATGTYVPSRDQYGLPNGRQNRFTVKSDVSILGNAVNSFYDPISPPMYFAKTMLSGDILNNDDGNNTTESDEYDNAHYLVFVTEYSTHFEIKDVIFQRASNLNPPYSSVSGSALVLDNFTSNPIRKISNCLFKENRGWSGAALFSGTEIGSSQIEITNCTFQNNISDFTSTIYLSNSSPKITSCLFFQNEGSRTFYTYGIDGGDAIPVLSNCIFRDNINTSEKLFDVDSEFGTNITTIINSTFISPETARIHTRDNGGESTLIIKNSILDNVEISRGSSPNTEVDVSHSVLTDASCPSDVNCGDMIFFDVDSEFIGFRPIAGSLGIDKGTHAGIDIPTFDYLNLARIRNNRIDIGAVEQGSTCSTALILDKDLPPFNGDTGIYGTWEATESIIIKEGFEMTDEVYLSLRAPSVEFEGAFSKMNMSNLQIDINPCH